MREGGELMSRSEFAGRLADAVGACADRIDQHQRQIRDQKQFPVDYLIEKTDSGSSRNAGSFEELLSAVKQMQVLAQTDENVEARRKWHRTQNG
jgi:hypothetical protein